jgi:hypothetical protein
LIIGIPGGILIFSLIFLPIYIITEIRKPKGIFKQEAQAEDKHLIKEFPKEKKEETEEEEPEEL